jgi:hypothetical protein
VECLDLEERYAFKSDC